MIGLVDQYVGAQPGALQMDRQYAPVELARALRAADHARFRHEAEYSYITHARSGERHHPMQRVAALEDLQIAGLEHQRADQALISIQHCLNSGIILVNGTAQMRAVLEVAAKLRVLYGKRHRVVI